MPADAIERRPPLPRRHASAPLAPWLCAAGVVGPLAAVTIPSLLLGVEPSRLLRDPIAYSEPAFYAGFFSNLGVLACWTAAFFCFTAAAALHGRDRGARWAALAAGGALSAVLGLDDLFMIHDEMSPDWPGVPEPVPLAAYAAAALWYLWRFRAFHLSMDTGLLAAALLLLGASVGVDAVFHDAYVGIPVLLEDGFKFGGICAWAACHAAAAYRGPRGEPARSLAP